RSDDKLAIRIRKKLFDLRLARGVLGSRLVPGHGNPLADSEIRKTGAHRGVAGDNAIEDGWEALREDHPFASAGRAPDEVRVSSRPSVVARDDALGHARHFGVGLIGEVEIRLLIAHEREVKTGSGL